MNILAIETSCDETSVAIVRDGRTVLANVVASQIGLHTRFGGVVPELASRQHIITLIPTLEEALRQAGLGWDGIDAIAVTCGPGLAGALLVGVNAAKALAFAREKPLVAVNHLEAHIYSNWIIPETLDHEAALSAPTSAPAAPTPTRASAALRALGAEPPTRGPADLPAGPPAGGRPAVAPPPPAEVRPDLSTTAPTDPAFPLLCLVVSGGHTELVYMSGHGRYSLLGKTVDDAAGEAFDKVARILGLPYPGGPAIQEAARGGDPDAVDLPRAVLRGSYDFSFSGLKTAALRQAQQYGPPLSAEEKAAIAEEARRAEAARREAEEQARREEEERAREAAAAARREADERARLEAEERALREEERRAAAARLAAEERARRDEERRERERQEAAERARRDEEDRRAAAARRDAEERAYREAQERREQERQEAAERAHREEQAPARPPADRRAGEERDSGVPPARPTGRPPISILGGARPAPTPPEPPPAAPPAGSKATRSTDDETREPQPPKATPAPRVLGKTQAEEIAPPPFLAERGGGTPPTPLRRRNAPPGEPDVPAFLRERSTPPAGESRPPETARPAPPDSRRPSAVPPASTPSRPAPPASSPPTAARRTPLLPPNDEEDAEPPRPVRPPPAGPPRPVTPGSGSTPPMRPAAPTPSQTSGPASRPPSTPAGPTPQRPAAPGSSGTRSPVTPPPAPRPAPPPREVRPIPKSVQARPPRKDEAEAEEDDEDVLGTLLDEADARKRSTKPADTDEDLGDDDEPPPPARPRRPVGLEGARPPEARVPVGKRDKPPLPVADFAASFQEAAVEILVDKTVSAAAAYKVRTVLLAGGVAANLRLRERLQERIGADIGLRSPPLILCTDNAAMVAAAAYFRYDAGLQHDWTLDIDPNARYLE